MIMADQANRTGGDHQRAELAVFGGDLDRWPPIVRRNGLVHQPRMRQLCSYRGDHEPIAVNESQDTKAIRPPASEARKFTTSLPNHAQPRVSSVAAPQ
jgi:hypothetical protein